MHMRFLVLAEQDYRLYLSDQGERLKRCFRGTNPNRLRLPCFQCQKMTPRVAGLCSRCDKPENRPFHTRDFITDLEVPNGDRILAKAHSTLGRQLHAFVQDIEHSKRRLEGYTLDLADRFYGTVPDATSLQEATDGILQGVPTMDNVALMILRLVDAWFPSSAFEDRKLDGGPLRIIVAEHAAGVVCEEINRGDAWIASQGLLDGRPTKHGIHMALSNVYLRLQGIPDKFIPRQ